MKTTQTNGMKTTQTLIAFACFAITACISNDPPDGTDAVASPQEGCSDLRHFGDYKADDWCWDPPAHYCAQGGSTVIRRACRPDFSLCCDFATTCIACGWHDCAKAWREECDSAPLGGPACEDPQIQPDFEYTFCAD